MTTSKHPFSGLVTLTTALRRQGRHAEPQALLQRELPLLVVVLVLLPVVLIRIRAVAVKHPHQQAAKKINFGDTSKSHVNVGLPREEVRGQDAEPHVGLQNGQKLEQRTGLAGLYHQNCDANQIVVGNGEVNDSFALGHH